ncbi:hypothetical protein [Janthinobacterium sp. OK676]|uniref:hypothetical protein n=1 Tax=Janthinobacterium sp. OK676 TaxID=1855295 RepID=UPI001113B097|nr:hypothetical protein [Janthinobacterium sp. OK676]
MSALIRSVELKLNRACEQVQLLSHSISDWAANNPVTADCKLSDGRLGFQLIQKDFTIAPSLDEWSLQFGECVHNLRSALDNLVFALARVKCDPPEKPISIAFPIYQDREKFEKDGRKKINQLPMAAAELIEKLQPFQRDGSHKFGTPERDALVLLQSLSNDDKHKVPSVVVLAPTEMGHDFDVSFYSDEDASANVQPDVTVWVGPLLPGTVLMELRTNSPLKSVNGAFEGHAIVAIETPSGPVAVVQTLQALHQYTNLVASQFRAFF